MSTSPLHDGWRPAVPGRHWDQDRGRIPRPGRERRGELDDDDGSLIADVLAAVAGLPLALLLSRLVGRRLRGVVRLALVVGSYRGAAEAGTGRSAAVGERPPQPPPGARGTRGRVGRFRVS